MQTAATFFPCLPALNVLILTKLTSWALLFYRSIVYKISGTNRSALIKCGLLEPGKAERYKLVG